MLKDNVFKEVFTEVAHKVIRSNHVLACAQNCQPVPETEVKLFHSSYHTASIQIPEFNLAAPATLGTLSHVQVLAWEPRG